MTNLQNAQASIISLEDSNDVSKNPWRYTWKKEKDKTRPQKDYLDMIKRCRFYYRKDPLTSTTINKLIDIGVNNIKFYKNNLSDNEFKLFEGIKPKLVNFAEEMALEYLISGLVVPEIEYGTATKDEIKSYGMKKYESLVVPKTMWIRDPTSIEIKASILPDQPSYFVVIPDEMLFFIRHTGIYPDGTKDLELFNTVAEYSPEFINKIIKGENKILLDNKLIFRRRVTTESQYPTPYLSSAVDILEHKRNLRRTDYSVANKVLSAILQVKVGSDVFPMTTSEEDIAYMDTLRGQLMWRNKDNNDVESIFQLFTSHVVELNWVFPDATVLLNDAKYTEINNEIMFALGFPRILITGETERSGAGDQEFASMAPIKTMENFREKILAIVKDITYQITKRNKFSSIPEVEFEPINFHKFDVYITALSKLFDSGGLSRDSMADVLGYNFNDESDKRADEQKKLIETNVPTFGENPNSRPPDTNNNSEDGESKSKEPTKKKEKVNTNGK